MSLWQRLLHDERGFLNFLPAAGMALFNLFKKPGVQKGAEALGGVLGGLAGGRAAGKEQDIAAQQNQSRLQQQLHQQLVQQLLQQSQLGAQKAQFERDSPNVRFGQAMRGNLAANVQDVSAQVPSRLQPYMVNFTGGLRPSALGEGGRAAGRQLADIGQSQMGQDTFSVPNLPDAPQMPGLPQANWLDKLLGIAGPAASTIGALGPLLNRRPGQPANQAHLSSPGLYEGLFR